jgi:electron transport complex protein RnfC
MGFLRTFKGGIHPPDQKAATKDRPIEVMPLPSRVVLPLTQHLGVPCEPVVKVGDAVQEGQLVGAAKGFVSAPVHASISGTVVAIEDHPHPASSMPVRAVVIENQTPPTALAWERRNDGSALSAKELLEAIRAAGVVGLGGAAFPTHVKLSPAPPTKIDTLILNGVECEPYLTADHRLMLERSQELVEGTRILLRALGSRRVCFGIEKNKPDAIAIMQGHAANAALWQGATVEIVPLEVKYPQGAEKQLIKAVTGKEVPSGGLPFQIGVVVQNVGTAVAVYEAVAKGKPLIERVLTVSGDGVQNPRNLLVRIGTSFAQVIEAAGGMVPGEYPVKVIMGGPMMGLAQYTLDVPVIKGTSGIVVLQQRQPVKSLPCVKCGSCVDLCPMGLMPNRIAYFAERQDFAECDAHHVRDCVECGACTYVCFSRRPIVHLVKLAKASLIKAKKP